jgi:branched-chain amino acid transport system permease protein
MTGNPPTPGPAGYRMVIGSRESRLVAVGGTILLVVLASLPAWGSSGVMRFLVEVLTFLALAQMWNLLAGYAGLVSIGQQAFVGLGAYGLFVMSDIVDLPPPVPVLVTAVLAGLIALAISPFVFRLYGGYFAIGTWVVAEVFRLVIVQIREVGAGTGASVQSLIAIPAPERQALAYWLALALGFGSIIVVTLIMRSRLGLELTAIRDSEVAARSLGVDVFRAKLVIWVIAGMGCAAAGAVFYMQALRIQPSAAFGVDWTAKMIFIVIIGGVGRIEGPVVGTIAFFILQSTLASLGALYLVILGAVAIGVTLFAPQGVWGVITARLPVSLFGVQRRLRPAIPPGASG